MLLWDCNIKGGLGGEECKREMRRVLFISPLLLMSYLKTQTVEKCIHHAKGRDNVNMCSSFCDPVNNFTSTCSCTCGCQHSLGVAVVVVLGLSLLQILTYNHTLQVLQGFWPDSTTTPNTWLTFFVPSNCTSDKSLVSKILSFASFFFHCLSDILIYISMYTCFRNVLSVTI